MSNKDLLKQAIAEAKTIREAAITNAKEALEETLTPHLKEMLAQKLQEMEDMDEEEVMDENIYEAEEEEVDAEEGEEGAEEEAGEEEEELEIEDMSVEDLKDLIRDIVAQETGHDEEAEMETGEEQDDMVSMDGDSEEIDINELLAELEGMDKQPVDEDALNEDMGAIQTVVDAFGVTKDVAQMILGVGGTALFTAASAGASKLNDMAKAGKFGEYLQKKAQGLEAQANLGSPELRGFKEGVDEDEMEEGIGSAIKGGLDKFDKWIGSTSDKMSKAGEKSKVVQSLGKGVEKTQKAVAPKGYSSGALYEDSKDLQEALKAVKILRNQLQEVNLLNAKLLYVNKVFKSTNLSEGQKVNVIAAFDKAETVKEVKLVFETVSKNVVAKPVAIKEHRSFASKATGNAQTTAPKEILSEVSEQVARWQKLAGIIKS